jgi:hypothetical protein
MRLNWFRNISDLVHFILLLCSAAGMLFLFIAGGLISYIKPFRKIGGWLQDKSGVL